MRRGLLYEIATVDGKQELDLLSGSLTSFKITRPVRYYTIGDGDVGRPDAIAFLFYQQERYWWVIAVTNNIIDPINEMTTGRILKIPDILDIYDYYKAARKR